MSFYLVLVTANFMLADDVRFNLTHRTSDAGLGIIIYYTEWTRRESLITSGVALDTVVRKNFPLLLFVRRYRFFRARRYFRSEKFVQFSRIRRVEQRKRRAKQKKREGCNYKHSSEQLLYLFAVPGIDASFNDRKTGICSAPILYRILHISRAIRNIWIWPARVLFSMRQWKRRGRKFHADCTRAIKRMYVLFIDLRMHWKRNLH